MDNTLKTCTKCNEEKDRSEFALAAKNPDGLFRWCRSCKREYDKRYNTSNQPRQDRMRVRKREIRAEFELYKATLSCRACGEDAPECLDFHHIDPSLKSFAIANGLNQGLGMDAIMNEVSKCMVLCANCHRKYHAGNLHL